MEVAGLVLAAGAGRRYGMPKALVPYGGRLLVQRAAATLRAAGCAPRVVVLGAGGARVRAALAGPADTGATLDGAALVDNPDWPSGMGSSLRVGLAALAGTGAGAVVVLLVDMPGVTAAAVRRVAAGAHPQALVMAGYPDGRRGHPVLLGREHWAGVGELAVADVGARAYLRAQHAQVRVVDCGDVADDTDLDTAGQTHA